MSLSALAEQLGWPVLVPGVIHAHEVFHIILLVGAIHQWLFMWELARSPAAMRRPATNRPTAPMAVGTHSAISSRQLDAGHRIGRAPKGESPALTP